MVLDRSTPADSTHVAFHFVENNTDKPRATGIIRVSNPIDALLSKSSGSGLERARHPIPTKICEVFFIGAGKQVSRVITRGEGIHEGRQERRSMVKKGSRTG